MRNLNLLWKYMMYPTADTNVWIVRLDEKDEEDRTVFEVRTGVGAVENTVLMGEIRGWAGVTWEGVITNWHGLWTEEPRTGGSRYLNTAIEAMVTLLANDPEDA